MKTHRKGLTGNTIDFDTAIKRASAIADELIGENMLLSWYDRERDLESPAHASECHEGCPIKGFWDYALNRGGVLAVDFDDGRFVFCFRTLNEFAQRLRNIQISFRLTPKGATTSKTSISRIMPVFV